MSENGLYVVATPIGNLEDISLRALRILGEVDCIAAEDTRHTVRLLNHYDIRTPLVAMHDHNEQRQVPGLLKRIANGESVALVSDAGTPLISDPGFRLVLAAREQQLPVYSVPGASAVTAALSVAGLPSDRFTFEGFLPARSAARKARLNVLASTPGTLVLFESSHRIQSTVSDLVDVFGPERGAALCRELTKQFETVICQPLGLIAQCLEEDPDQRRGEFVLLIEAARQTGSEQFREGSALARALLEFLPASQAARVAARVSGARRQVLYETLQKQTEV